MLIIKVIKVMHNLSTPNGLDPNKKRQNLSDRQRKFSLIMIMAGHH